jgi:threonine/homoserine/homoserine lactone efflux protein
LPCGQSRGAYDSTVPGYSTAENIVLLIAAVAPVAFLVWFAWWFLRAGKRYDDQERAAERRPPQ